MSLHVEAPSVRVRGEHRLAVDTWDELQLRLERITGIPPEAQRLELDGAPLETISASFSVTFPSRVTGSSSSFLNVSLRGEVSATTVRTLPSPVPVRVAPSVETAR